jgi:hypothetical protein
MDLFTTYSHHSELQVITALSLISTNHKSPQHTLSLFPACCVFISRSLVTALTVEMLQLPALSFYLHSLGRRTQLSTNDCQLTTNWVAPLYLSYNHFARTERKTLFPTVTLLLCICYSEKVFTEPLTKNGLHNTFVYSSIV